jgi:hypothetical protein
LVGKIVSAQRCSPAAARCIIEAISGAIAFCRSVCREASTPDISRVFCDAIRRIRTSACSAIHSLVGETHWICWSLACSKKIAAAPSGSMLMIGFPPAFSTRS